MIGVNFNEILLLGKRKRVTKNVLCMVPRVLVKRPSLVTSLLLSFIDTEGSTDHLDVARTEKPTSWTMLISFIKEFAMMPGGYQTLVIDTIDWAEQLCVEHICAQHQKKGN